MLSPFPSTVLMIRPCNFGFNKETAATNIFQKQLSLSQNEIQARALNEFDHFVKLLNDAHVTVVVFNDYPNPFTPDSIFPNNWFSSHRNGSLILYPMLSPNRRKERRGDIIEHLKNKYLLKSIVDLTYFESENKILEGTGSLIFDHINKIAYSNISSRTNKEPAEKVCEILGYRLNIFSAEDPDGNEVYHTNVLLSIGNGFSIICSEAIKNSSERKSVLYSLKQAGLEIIEINPEQMISFCGNALQLQNSKGEKILVMSDKAWSAFTRYQIKTLEKYSSIIHTPLETIEMAGGGSARCMLAEIYSTLA